MSFFVEYNPVIEYELNGKLESEARQTWCAFARVGAGNRSRMGDKTSVAGWQTEMPETTRCIASACAHWRWLHKGATRYEKQTFESEFPVPNGSRDTAPADVPDGWTFIAWDANVKKDTAKPRFWAKRAVQIILPRGLCGLAGEE